jgi:hypothetical protein
MNGDILGHPLFGVRTRRTVGAIGTIVVLAVAVVVAERVPQTILADRTGGTAIWLFNGYIGVVLLLTMAAVTLIPVVYGVWNGGPVLAVILPLSPVITGMALSGELRMTTGLTVALCSGAAGAVAGTETFWIERRRSNGSQSGGSSMAQGKHRTVALAFSLGLSAAIVVVGGWSLWTLISQASLFHPGAVIATPFVLVAGVNVGLLTANTVVPGYVPSFTLFCRELQDVDEL